MNSQLKINQYLTSESRVPAKRQPAWRGLTKALIVYWLTSGVVLGADLPVPGTIYPSAVVPIVARASGVLTNELIEHGQWVKKDQNIIRYRVDNGVDFRVITLPSPTDGFLIKNSTRIGQVLAQGDTIAYVTQSKRFHIFATLNEQELTAINVKKRYPCINLADNCIPVREKTRLINSTFPSLNDIKFELTCDQPELCLKNLTIGSPITLYLKELTDS